MWSPLTLERLLDLLEAEQGALDAPERRLWELVRIPPSRWRLPPWGDPGGGFWAVGLIGRLVLWYNDIEHGFNTSPYRDAGTIDAYGCDQDGLGPALRELYLRIVPGPDHPG